MKQPEEGRSSVKCTCNEFTEIYDCKKDCDAEPPIKRKQASVDVLTGNKLSGADFSEDRQYRYSLWRIWDIKKPLVMFIGLNPSTANETDNDPTIKSVCRISKNNGFGGVYMMNCFPLVSTDPNVLKDFWSSGNPYTQNQDTINIQKLKSVSDQCEAVVFAWGSFAVVKEVNRDKELTQMFPDAMALFINKNGSPKHPLYCKSDSKLISYNNTQTKKQ